MSAILNSLNAHNFLIFQPILMTLVSNILIIRVAAPFKYLILTLQAMRCAFCRSREWLCCKSVMPRTGAELK